MAWSRTSGAWLAAATVACGVERLDPGEDAIPPRVQDAFVRSCGIDGCHDAGAQPPTLGPASLAGLRAPSTAGLPYVSLGDIDRSQVAVRILDGTMPPATNPADAADLGVILLWIAGVAVDDGAETDGIGDSGGSDDDGSTDDGRPARHDCVGPAMRPPEVTFGDVWPVFEATCGGLDICHGVDGPGSAVPTMLDEASAFQQILEGSDASTETTLAWVEPGSPDASYLWHKLMGTGATPGIGTSPTPMPLVGGLLCASDLELVHAWILQGAAP